MMEKRGLLKQQYLGQTRQKGQREVSLRSLHDKYIQMNICRMCEFPRVVVEKSKRVGKSHAISELDFGPCVCSPYSLFENFSLSSSHWWIPPPPSKSWLMTSRGRKLCSFVSYKVQGSADREAFRASADTEASEREVAVIKGGADIQNLW